jgi:hypothetical protein
MQEVIETVHNLNHAIRDQVTAEVALIHAQSALEAARLSARETDEYRALTNDKARDAHVSTYTVDHSAAVTGCRVALVRAEAAAKIARNMHRVALVACGATEAGEVSTD